MDHYSQQLESSEDGLYVEEVMLAEHAPDLLFIAPHGGGVEPRTTDQAIQAALCTDSDADMWGTRGYHRAGPYSRWHPPSDSIGSSRHPFLEDRLRHPYEVVVSFHLKSETGITIGGRYGREQRDDLGRALRWITEAVDVVDGGQYGGQAPSNIVNSLSKRGGIQIETGPDILYENSKWQVARTVADTVSEFTDTTQEQ